jgi:acetamidase/formamidase
VTFVTFVILVGVTVLVISVPHVHPRTGPIPVRVPGTGHVLGVTLTDATFDATLFLFRLLGVLQFSSQNGGVGAEDLTVNHLAEADALLAVGAPC